MRGQLRSRVERRRVDGVLLLDKPSGISSNAALQRARRAYGAQKAGHTGTLDPLASGLLPICLGEATKFAQFLLDATKGYVATVRFGVRTDTLDAEGEERSRAAVTLSREDVEGALSRFVGPQLQRPPAHAAIKHQGRPLYAYARAGEEAPREPRPVEIYALTLRTWSSPDAVIDVTCSKGTYVRVLAADLGDLLGCGAHLAALRRTATGGFAVADAVSLERLEAMDETARAARLLPAEVLVSHLPRVVLPPSSEGRFMQGQAVRVDATACEPDRACAVFAQGRLLGVADTRDGVAHPRRLIVPHAGAAVEPG